MKPEDIRAAAGVLLRHWRQSTRLAELPAQWRPQSRAEGYAIQSEVAKLAGQNVVGWKIAATSQAGQQHIHVDGPMAGCLLAARAREQGARISLAGNNMKVAEAEFAFRLGADLPRRGTSYGIDEVLAAVATLHPAIEVPDSRFSDFTRVGEAQLIADLAGACWFVIGPATRADWRAFDLAKHDVKAYRNGALAGQGSGANVLGDPRTALAWVANELRIHGEGLRAGEVIITGTCLTPVPVSAGDSVNMDFGEFGAIDVGFG